MSIYQRLLRLFQKDTPKRAKPSSDLQGLSPEWAEQLNERLRAAGCPVTEMTPEESASTRLQATFIGPRTRLPQQATGTAQALEHKETLEGKHEEPT
jgi:hypothetical protein